MTIAKEGITQHISQGLTSFKEMLMTPYSKHEVERQKLSTHEEPMDLGETPTSKRSIEIDTDIQGIYLTEEEK